MQTFSTTIINLNALCNTDTHRYFGAVGQGVFKLHAEGEFDVFSAEGAGLLDVELVASLLDGHLQVVVLRQLPLHYIDACRGQGDTWLHLSPLS